MKRTLSLLCALGSLLGCEASSIENEPLPPPDDGAEAAKDARTPGPTRDAGRADAASVQRADAGTGSERGDDAATPEGMTEPDPADAEPLAPDAGSGERPEASAESKIAGSAAANDCSSYGELLMEL